MRTEFAKQPVLAAGGSASGQQMLARLLTEYAEAYERIQSLMPE